MKNGEEEILETEQALDDCMESFAALTDTEATKYDIDIVYMVVRELVMVIEQKLIYQNGESREFVEKMKEIARERFKQDINFCSEAEKWR